MFAIGNDELERLPPLGEEVWCTRCGCNHPVEYGKSKQPDGTMAEDRSLGFYRCTGSGKLYLAGVNGKALK